MKHLFLILFALACTITANAQYTLTAEDVDFDPQTGTIIKYTNTTEKDIIIPEQINGVKVLIIGDEAFAWNQFTSVTIPKYVTKIGDGAFAVNKIISINIPQSATEIGAYAFVGNQLTSLNIPNSVTKIGNGAFAANQLTKIKIPNSLAEIGNETFANNQLANVDIPKVTTKIGTAAFGGNQLTNIDIPNSVREIGALAFGANKLKSVEIPNSVTKIGAFAFASEKQMKEYFKEQVDKNVDFSTSGNNLEPIKLPSKTKDGEPLQWWTYDAGKDGSPLLNTTIETEPIITDLTKGYTCNIEELKEKAEELK